MHFVGATKRYILKCFRFLLLEFSPKTKTKEKKLASYEATKGV